MGYWSQFIMWYFCIYMLQTNVWVTNYCLHLNHSCLQCCPGACFIQVYVWYLQLLYHVFILCYFLLCLVIYLWQLQDLRNNAYDWSRICHMDSDNDGRTNGDELGDPNCVWTTGTTPTGQASGHPGKHCEHSISAIGNTLF